MYHCNICICMLPEWGQYERFGRGLSIYLIRGEVPYVLVCQIEIEKCNLLQKSIAKGLLWKSEEIFTSTN